MILLDDSRFRINLKLPEFFNCSKVLLLVDKGFNRGASLAQ
jgi:hypothetical protein